MAEKTPEEIEKEKADKAAAEEAERKAAADKKKKVKFDEDQQEIVNRLYNQGFREGAEQAEQRLQEALNTQKAEFEQKIAQTKAELEAAVKKDKDKADEQKPNPEIEQLRAQLDEFKGILNGIKLERDELKTKVEGAAEQNRKARKKDRFLDGMKEANVAFFDTLEAYELAEKDGYDWDPSADKPTIKNKETGRPRLNENGDPMDVIDFIRDFAKRKGYLVKAANQDGGAGGSESRRLEQPAKKDYSKMTPDEFEAERQRVLNQARN